MIIGITGSFGSGKTTVAKMLALKGAKVLDADKIAHDLIEPRGACFKPVVRYFGKEILSGGRIDRAKLAKIVFKNPKHLKKLCAIIHPQVYIEIQKEIKRSKKNQIFTLDAPLLLEAGWHRMVDVLIVVRASQSKQIERVTRRMHISQNEVLRRIKQQMSIQQKLRMADIVIDNRGSLNQTKQQVQSIWAKLSQRQSATKS